eukprot:CAMPEP_0179183070 /NCGR_PEP_ID=MMETSP0796-20121207/90717_1 /TAXON_ID=73915 /ORGANISM="Pyrodinium bahamense, Strain pbaha01" /LENGTH=445 /DNA_ID=CAMNT_0020886923 /DNA_START=102 /DNA_END=1438 /DNA_ORIENTATION=+
MALGSGLLQFFAGAPRECFSDTKASAWDLSFVCHDVRGVELSEDEKVFVTLKDMRRHSGEQFVPLGSACHLRSVELDASLLLRVWAARDEAAARLRSEGVRGRRNCGELRIPLHRVVMHCDGMLYQTWITLDTPGLCDSVASVGLCEGSSSFEQKLVDGPRQLFQPRAFLSLGKTADLSSTGDLLLSADAAPEARVASGALQASRAGDPPINTEQHARAAGRLQDLRGQVQEQAQAMEALRRQVQEAEDRLVAVRDASRDEAEGTGAWTAGLTPPERSRAGSTSGSSALGLAKREAEPLGRTIAIEAEVEQLRASNSLQHARLSALQAELEDVRQQANDNVDAANEQIRALRRDKDASLHEGRRLEVETQQLTGQKQELSSEKQQLVEQVEALKRLVEELYETVNCAGLQASRRPVDSINAIFKFIEIWQDEDAMHHVALQQGMR